MKPLAIIPARAGSKRLPGKNIADIGGRTLVELALEQGWEALGRSVGNVILTTDIPDDGKPFTEISWWRRERPASLCRDDTPMMEVVSDAVAFAVQHHVPFDCVVLLQPTSPLRSLGDIRACIDILEHGADAAVSVRDTEWPELYTMGHAGRMRRWTAAEHAHMVFPNGAVFAARRSVLEAGKDWWTADVVVAHLMPPERSIDIDTIYDLEEARRLWSMRTP